MGSYFSWPAPGGGKTHIMRMIATMVAGVALVIVPLLSLTADLLGGLREGSSTDALVEAHHVDELPADVVRDTLVPHLDSLDANSSSLIFLLCLPQELSENGILRAAMLRCHGRGVLRLVALDEAHLYAQHGTTFRGCIHLLLDQIFRVVFSRTSEQRSNKIAPHSFDADSSIPTSPR